MDQQHERQHLQAVASKYLDHVMPIPSVITLLSPLSIAPHQWKVIVLLVIAYVAANLLLSQWAYRQGRTVHTGAGRIVIMFLTVPPVVYAAGEAGEAWYVALPATAVIPVAFKQRPYLATLAGTAAVTLAAHAAGAPPRRLFAICVTMMVVTAVSAGIGMAFRDVARRALAAERAQSDFLATMSHEIRTPMNGLLTSLELMKSEELQQSQRELLEIARGSASGLLTIINDILDFSKIQAGKLNIDTIDFDLHQLLDTLESECNTRALADDTHVAFPRSPTLPRFVRGDPTRLGQVLRNLLSNALKFGKGTFVELSLECTALDHDRARYRFQIADGGPGISEEEHSRLFRRFEQLSTGAARKYGGTGLGLAICQSLVEMMGGKIGVESSAGSGAIFWFELDLPEGSEPVPSSRRQRQPVIRPLHVLVVDDNSVNLKVTQRLLSALKCTSVAVESGAAALKALEREEFDCVLMDCQMPEMDGFETTRHIRELHGSKRHIIALTANVRDADRLRCYQAGMDDFLGKPIRKAALAQALAQVASPSDVTHVSET